MKKKLPHKRIVSHKKAPRLFILRWWFFLLLLVPLFGLFGLLKITSPFCANSITCINDLSGKTDPNAKFGTFMGKKVYVPSTLMTELSQPVKTSPVLGATTEFKHINIDLTHQHLYAMEGSKIVYDFPISSGKWHPTPTGIFHIWIKLRAVRMAGGSGADAYDLPNVPWTMFFAGGDVGEAAGFSIHGAYWHNNFGHPMSHGCVNMRIADAKTVFDWASPATTGYTTYATNSDPGTEVDIYGDTPNE